MMSFLPMVPTYLPLYAHPQDCAFTLHAFKSGRSGSSGRDALYMGNIGSIWFLGFSFLTMFIVFLPGLIQGTRLLGLIASIPASPSDHLFGKRRPVWAKCYYLQYIHASVRSLNDLPICHVC